MIERGEARSFFFTYGVAIHLSEHEWPSPFTSLSMEWPSSFTSLSICSSPVYHLSSDTVLAESAVPFFNWYSIQDVGMLLSKVLCRPFESRKVVTHLTRELR